MTVTSSSASAPDGALPCQCGRTWRAIDWTIDAFALAPIWLAGMRVSFVVVLLPPPPRKSSPIRCPPLRVGAAVGRGAGARVAVGRGAGARLAVADGRGLGRVVGEAVGRGLVVALGVGRVVGRAVGVGRGAGAVVWTGRGAGIGSGTAAGTGGAGCSASVGAIEARLSATGSGACAVRPTSSARLTVIRSGIFGGLPGGGCNSSTATSAACSATATPSPRASSLRRVAAVIGSPGYGLSSEPPVTSDMLVNPARFSSPITAMTRP